MEKWASRNAEGGKKVVFVPKREDNIVRPMRSTLGAEKEALVAKTPGREKGGDARFLLN